MNEPPATLMKRFALVFICLPFLIQAAFSQEILREEAQNAFEHLNNIRMDPSRYSDEVGVDLSYVEKRDILVWNETLAEVAIQKAIDMAERKYFSHVDPDGNGINIMIKEAGYEIPDGWVEDVANNYFESLQAGTATGIKVINDLVEDKGTDPPGHRNHLLGIDDFWSNCMDIGIGMIKMPGSRYRFYTCVIIAKHDF